MRVRDKGPLRWLAWAFFSWTGKIKRRPYADGFGVLLLVRSLYQNAVVRTVAEYIYPPAGGGPVSLEYITDLAKSPRILPFLLPLVYMYSVLGFKRLRSIEAPVFIAVIFAALGLSAPILMPQYAEMLSLSVFAYHAILTVLPAKEDRISPYERKYRVWQAIATPEGGPVRLRGKDIKHWHIVGQGKKKK